MAKFKHKKTGKIVAAKDDSRLAKALSKSAAFSAAASK